MVSEDRHRKIAIGEFPKVPARPVLRSATINSKNPYLISDLLSRQPYIEIFIDMAIRQMVG